MDLLSETTGDSGHTSEIEDTLEVAAKDWNRLTNAAEKTGYREGIEDGSESVFQEGFDEGYEDAFRTAFILGKFKSLMNAMPQDTEHPRDIKEILDKTRRGACCICKTRDKNRSDDVVEKKSFSQIVSEQRAHSGEVIQRLHQYFQPVIERLNIDMSDMPNMHNQVQGSPENK